MESLLQPGQHQTVNVELEFSGSDRHVRLERVSFWPSGTDKTEPTEVRWVGNLRRAAREGSDVFQWREGARALAVLLLRAYAAGGRLSGEMEGGAGSLAASLVQCLRTKQDEKGNTFWIHSMFTPQEVQDQDREDPRLPPSMFTIYGNSDQDSYGVALGPDWLEASLKVFRGTKGILPEEAGDLADAIESQVAILGQATQPSRLTTTLHSAVWSPSSNRFEILSDTILPVPHCSGVHVSVNLNMLAFPYLVWISSERKVQPLYPWRGFLWDKVLRQAPLSELALPSANAAGKESYYPLCSKPGVEMVIALASTRPIRVSTLKELPRVFRNCLRWVPKVLPDLGRLYQLTDRRALSGKPSATRLGAPVVMDDPLAQLREGLLSHVGHELPCIAGLAFTTVDSKS